MWSHSQNPLRRLPALRRRAAGALVALACLGVAGCGFQPLYGSGPGSAAPEQLAAIQIDPLPNRTGQLLHNDLRDRLNPQGQPSYPDYRLSVAYRESTTRFGLRIDETATRAALTVRANFRLMDLENDAVVASGSTSSTNSYAIGESPYAVQSAEEDALRRAVREVAESIRTRLAGALADWPERRAALEAEQAGQSGGGEQPMEQPGGVEDSAESRTSQQRP